MTAQTTCQVCGQPVGDDESGPWVAFQALYVMKIGSLPGSIERTGDGTIKHKDGTIEPVPFTELFSCHDTCLHMMVDGELAALREKPRVDKGKPKKKK